MANAESFKEILAVIHKKFDELEKALKEKTTDGFVRFGNRSEDRIEFNIGLQRFVAIVEIKFGGGYEAQYHLKTYEIVMNETSYGTFALKQKPEMDIAGDYETLFWKSPKIEERHHRQIDATVIRNFSHEYIFQLLKLL